jgi:hypothetical protein
MFCPKETVRTECESKCGSDTNSGCSNSSKTRSCKKTLWVWECNLEDWNWVWECNLEDWNSKALLGRGTSTLVIYVQS